VGEQQGSRAACGEGLAEHSLVPAKIAELLASLAENLEAHVPAIDLYDRNGRLERDAYEVLVAEYRAIASRLQAVAQQMAEYRDLPVARHLEAAMSAPEILYAFRRYVKLEREVVELLQGTLTRDQQMLDQMEDR
jgi:hypothetical protein